VVLERTNFRYFDPASIDEKPSFICIDVSFISLGLILPVAAALLADAKGELVALVKPQFEAGREQVGKGGIVRDPSIHAEVIEKVRGYAAGCGLAAVSTVESPIKGAKGNTEFLMRCIHG
jgi:23S rRNA (cytidine1920-2'-O)/16S rRNA (cytidine1409-2'-O)-methyltransferase